MDTALREILRQGWHEMDFHYRSKIEKFYESTGISQKTIRDFILRETEITISEGDGEGTKHLLHLAKAIENPDIAADVFNNLLLMPNHNMHQQIVWEIQMLGNPSSLTCIRVSLENGLRDINNIDYYSRRSLVGWFGYALESIDTAEATSMMEEFSKSSDPDIAKVMTDFLKKFRGRQIESKE